MRATREAARRRRAILAAVRRRPGLGVTRLAAAVGLGSGSFYAHLRALVAEGRLVVRRRGKHRLVFPADAPAPRHVAPPLRLGAKARRVAAYVATHPGLDLAAYARRLPVARRTVYYHFRNLVRRGLVESAVKGRYVALRATPRLRRLLRE